MPTMLKQTQHTGQADQARAWNCDYQHRSNTGSVKIKIRTTCGAQRASVLVKNVKALQHTSSQKVLISAAGTESTNRIEISTLGLWPSFSLSLLLSPGHNGSCLTRHLTSTLPFRPSQSSLKAASTSCAISFALPTAT